MFFSEVKSAERGERRKEGREKKTPDMFTDLTTHLPPTNREYDAGSLQAKQSKPMIVHSHHTLDWKSPRFFV